MGITEKPKCCKVCNQISYLRCLYCNVVFCSNACYVKDWDKHRKTHGTQDNIFRSASKITSNKKSVQNRLLQAVHANPKTEAGKKSQDEKLQPVPYETKEDSKTLKSSVSVHENLNVKQEAEIPTRKEQEICNKLPEVEKPIVNSANDISSNAEKNVSTRFLISSVKVKELPLGLNQFMFIDGSKLKEGKICICEYSVDNEEFYRQMEDDIAKYMKENKDANNYQPIVTEMILARYSDGSVYRAVCESNTAEGYGIIFIDYRNKHVTTPENIWKMPEHLLKNILARAVPIKLKSGRSFREIDEIKTDEKLSEVYKFEGYVERSADNKTTITLDDSLVVFLKT